ncbi:hypothetical protein [Jannaschia sp. R86511]|uniref:hypothetical protein n=1 Tax=Jannaschia sp. R86511 TaxID=3093853 RepID=UPI0036D3002A
MTSSGSIVVTEDGAVIDGVDVHGYIHVRADDVTITRSRVSYTGAHSVRIFDGSEGTVLEDLTIICGDPRTNGVVFGGYRAVRVSVTGCRNGLMSSTRTPATIVDSTVDGVVTTAEATPSVTPGSERLRDATAARRGSVLGPPAGRPAEATSPTDATPPTDTRGASTQPPAPPVADADADEATPSRPAPTPAPPAPTPAPPAAPAPTGTKAQVMAQAGPRVPATATITGSQARQRILDTGLLEKVNVRGTLDLSRVDRGYTIRDITLDAAGGRYGIHTMVGYSGVGAPKAKQTIEYVEVHGATSAGLYLRNVTVRNADVWGNIDNIKSADNVSVTSSWLHDQAWVSGAHADAIQIQYGTGQYYANNVIDAHHGDSSVAGPRAGEPANAALQTGSMIGNASARFVANWWDGGHYTVRILEEGPPTLDYQFRDNRFGRSFTYGPVAGAREARAGDGGTRMDDSNVWDDDGSPV